MSSPRHDKAMKNPLPKLIPIILLAGVLIGERLSAAPFVWNGTNGVSTDTNWSDMTNWISIGLPGSGDDVVFTNGAAVVNTNTINNVVDTSFTINSLNYGNTNGFIHNTFIPGGVVLTVNGALNDGFGASVTTVVGNTNTIRGPGELDVFGTINVGTDRGSGFNVLDMSGLGTFVNNAGTSGSFLMSQTSITSPTVNLASNSTINVGTIQVENSNGQNGRTGVLNLGKGTNIIQANTINIGLSKGTGTIQFVSGAPSTAGVSISGTGGGTRATITMAVSSSGSGSSVGNLLLVGHPVTVLASTVGVANRGNDTGSATATVTFDNGTFDATSIILGQFSANTNLNTSTGTFTVGGNATNTATLIVNSTNGPGGGSFIIADSTLTNGTGRGILNINTNGTAQVFCPITKSTTANATNTATITMNGGTLNMEGPTNGLGAIGGPIDNLIMTNGTLVVAVTTLGNSAVVSNLTTGGATNKISIISIPAVTGYPATFTVIKYANNNSIGGAGYNFGLGTLPVTSPAFQGVLVNNAANHSVDLKLTSGPAPAKLDVWSGAISGDWDVGNTANWLNNGLSATYNDSDFVQFDDTATGPTTINLTQQLNPSSVIVSNSALTYTFTGSGSISGVAGIVKSGTGTLILDNTGGDNYSGGITISNGTVQLGTNDFGGAIPTGSPLTDNGTLVLDRADFITLANVITGSGSVSHIGSGPLTLSGANSFSGTMTVASNSTLVIGNNSALGSTNGSTIISNGATMDIAIPSAAQNTVNLGGEQVFVSGAGVGGNSGAIINSSGTQQQQAVKFVTLLGDTTLGGTGRWDIRSPTVSNPSGSALSTLGQPWKLTINTSAQVSLVGATVDPALGDVEVTNGTLSIEEATTGIGNPANTLTVDTGATLQFFALTNLLNKNIVLNGDGTHNTLNNSSGNNTVIGPMTVNGSCLFNAGGTSLTLSNTITGSGSITKSGTAILSINGNASVGGGTFVSGGALLINGTLGGGVTNNSSSSIGGTGTSSGPTDVSGNLYPGPTNSAGTFTAAGGLTLESGAQVIFDLSSTNIGGNNDLLVVNNGLTLNGNTILINPLQLRLQPGTYNLVNYSGGINGTFGNVQTVQPSRFVFGLDNSIAGQINLIVTNGGNENLVWSSTSGSTTWDTGGQPNWTDLAGRTNTQFFPGDSVLLDDTAGVVTNLTLDNGPVQPSSITNNSSANNFLISGLGKITGTTGVTKMGTSTLTLDTTNDFTGPVNVLGGTVVVGCSNALGSTNALLTITNNAAVDFNVIYIGLKPTFVQGTGPTGNGALVNNGTNQVLPAVTFVTLTGDTTFGGSNRWDLRAPAGTTANPTNVALSTGGQPYNLTKVGTNFVGIVAATVDPSLANIDIKAGTLDIEGNITGVGDPTKTMTVYSNAFLFFFNCTNLVNKLLVLNDGATVTNNSGTNVFVGPVTLNGSNTFGIAGTSLAISNTPIGGSGNLYKLGTSPLLLSGTNTYTGNTVINTGTLGLYANGSISFSPSINIANGSTLDASHRVDGTLTLASGQLLMTGTNGTVNGTLTAGTGSTVSPGGAGTIGTLTVTNIVNLSGTTVMDLSKGTVVTNDAIKGAVKINYGGALNLNVIAGSLVGGENFKLFAATTYGGSFDSISPATPGPGLKWDTSSLTNNGILKVAAPTPATVKATVSGDGSTLTLSGTGTAGGTYRILTSTNVALPQASWTQMTNGSFNTSGQYTNTVSINPADAQRFFSVAQP